MTTSARVPSRPLRLRRPAVPRTVPEMRHAVADFAREAGAGDDALASIELAVSEAVTNAVVHAFVGLEPGTITLEAERADGEIVVRVADDGRGMRPRRDSPGLRVGLSTIAQLCDHVDLDAGPGGRGTSVRMVFAAPGVTGPRRSVTLGPTATAIVDLAEAVVAAGTWPRGGLPALPALLVDEGVVAGCAVDLAQDDGSWRRLAEAGTFPEGDPDVWSGPPPAAIESESDGADGPRRVTVPVTRGDIPVAIVHAGLDADAHDRLDEAEQVLDAIGVRLVSALAKHRLVSALERSTSRLEQILAALREAVTVTTADGRIVYANAAAVEILHARDVDELLAAAPGEVQARFDIRTEDGDPLLESMLPGRRVLGGEDPGTLVVRAVHKETGRARWTVTRSTRLHDHEPLAVNVFSDVTAEVVAERRLRFLAEAGRILGSSLDVEETLGHVVRLAVPGLADWCAIDLEGNGELRRLALAHSDPELVAKGEELRRRYPPDPATDRGVTVVLRTGEPVLVPEITDEMIVEAARDEEHLALLRAFGMRSAVVVPLTARGRVLGALTLVSSDSGRRFAEDDLDFAMDAAVRFAQAVDNARLHTGEA